MDRTRTFYSAGARIGRRAWLRGVSVAGAGAAVAGLGACSSSNKPAVTAVTGQLRSTALAPAGATPAVASSPGVAAAAPASSPAAQRPAPPVYSQKMPDFSKFLAQFNWYQLSDRTKPPAAVTRGRSAAVVMTDATNWDIVAGSTGPYMVTHNNLLSIAGGPASDPLQVTITPDNGLAQKYEAVAPDTWSFSLRPGATWQNVPPVNGRAFTAADVKFAYDTFASTGANKAAYSAIDRVETPDATTVTVHMKAPSPWFLTQMASAQTGALFAREQFESAEGLGARPIGTGPFSLRRWEPRSLFTFDKNPAYFMQDQRGQWPLLDALQGVLLMDEATLEASFVTKQLDFVRGISADLFSRLRSSVGDAALNLLVTPYNPALYHNLSLNLAEPPFNDVRVRRALSLAINRQAIIDDIHRGAANPAQPIPYPWVGFDWPPLAKDLGPYYQFDPNQAKQLLAQAGFANLSFNLAYDPTVTTLDAVQVMQTVQAQLQDIGVAMKLVNTPLATVAKQRFTGGFSGALSYSASVGVGATDYDGWTYGVYHSKSSRNGIHINDPEMDSLCEAQRSELDNAKRLALVKQIWQRDTQDQVYFTYLTQVFQLNVWHRYLHGLQGTLMLPAQAHLDELATAWVDSTAPAHQLQ